MENNESKEPKKSSTPKRKRAPAKKTTAVAKKATKAAKKAAPVRAVSGAGEGKAIPLDTLPTTTVRLWDRLLRGVGGVMNEERFHSLCRLSVRFGNWAVLAAYVLAVLVGLILAIKMHRFQIFFTGIGFVVLLSVLHYTAIKFIDTGRALIENSPNSVSTSAFPDSVALIGFVSAIMVLVGSIVTAIQMESLNIFLKAVPGFFILLFLVWLAINPGLTKTTVEKTDAVGEEAISVVSFFMKALLRMVPILFGILTIWGGVVLLIALLRSFGSDMQVMKSMATGMYGSMVLLWGAGLPFAAYIGYILYSLVIDLIRSILAIPARLE